ncbi:uncharacterized protein TNCV_1215001 [Trichonephila clavipes]|nr:uncharacterized protein TNCV_1215001 [Trichonephila clavipes]
MRVSLLSYIGNCSPDHDPRYRFSVLRPQTVWEQVFPGLFLTNTPEPAFMRIHNRSPLRPPIISGLTPLALQTAMAWCQWNRRYREPGSRLSLKQLISNSLLCHWGPTAVRISALDAVRYTTALRRIW